MDAVGVQVPVAGSYNSALEYLNWLQQKPPELRPPATSTSPLFSSVALCCSRAACIEPVCVHVPVAGLYSSALATSLQKSSSQLLKPPAASTWPSGSRVAVWNWRANFIDPVLAQVPVAGLYSSALVRVLRKLPASQPYAWPLQPPPATSTWPFGSRVAVCPDRATFSAPVGDHLPVAGLYSSAFVTWRLPCSPPATSTWPLRSSVAVASVTATGMFPVRENVRVAGLYSSALAVPPAAISTWPLGSRVAVWPDSATPSGLVAAKVFGGPSPPAVAAAAVVASTGIIRPAARAPAVATTASFLRRASRDLFVTFPMPPRGSTKDNPIEVKTFSSITGNCLFMVTFGARVRTRRHRMLGKANY